MSEDELPLWAHGAVLCNDCGHRWAGVWKLGAEELECPICHGTNTDREAEPTQPQEI